MPDNLEVIALQIANSKFKPFIVTSLYRPPGKPVSYFNDMETLLPSLNSDNKEATITGDTNCDFLDSSNNDTKNLKRVLSLHNLTQIIKEPTRITRISGTLIDHVITNKPDMVRGSGVISCGVSDHDIVFIERNVRGPEMKAPPKILNVHNFKRFENDSFRDDIKKIPMDQIRSSSGDVNTMWYWWKKFSLDILDKHAPISKIKIQSVTSEIKSLIRQKDYLGAKANKTGSNILRQAFVQIENKVNYKLALLWKNYCSRKIEENKGDLKNTWKIFKQAIGQGNKTNTVNKIYNNQEISEDNEKAKVCNEHFIAVGQKLAEDIPSTDESPTANITPTKTKFEFGCITIAQIEKNY